MGNELMATQRGTPGRVSGAAAKIGTPSINIRKPLTESERNASPYNGLVPSMNLDLVAPEISINHTSRLKQLTARIDQDYSRAGEAMVERAGVMAEKMKKMEGRIAKTKKAEDDRMKPLYVMIEKAGDEISLQSGIINKIDERLDAELRSMKEEQDVVIEWLMHDRADAKKRLNSQIATACELLKKEFADDKAWSRRVANERWDTTINRVASVIDGLEAERTNRMRSETRLFETVNAKTAETQVPVDNESLARGEIEIHFDERLEEEALKLQLAAQEEKKTRHDNAKVTMSLFREAMAKLAGHIDSERDERETGEHELVDRLLHSISSLDQCIVVEGKVRVEGETQMARLLEDMCSKLHQEIRREKDDRQQTERVLMKLLDDSVESIALRANDETVAKLKKRREQRDAVRSQREETAIGRQQYWREAFEKENALAAKKRDEEAAAALQASKDTKMGAVTN